MIHVVYLKSRNDGNWHLVKTFNSAEEAAVTINAIEEQIKKEGNEEAEVGLKIYETAFYIPEILKDIAPQKPMYN